MPSSPDHHRPSLALAVGLVLLGIASVQLGRERAAMATLEGTLAGIFASLVIAALAAAVGLFPWMGVLFVVIAAFVGTTFESVVGAALEKRQLLDNEALNFLNTLVGALGAAVFAPWVL